MADSWFAELALRDYQKDALRQVQRYVTAFRRGATAGAALVHMATGAGKTGVIATLARFLPNVRCVLVLAPRTALRHQLAVYVDHKFFEDLRQPLGQLPKDVLELRQWSQLGTSLRDKVVISTIQLVDLAARERRRKVPANIRTKSLGRLMDSVDLLLIDEGHYEPARSWSDAIRDFNVPRVLFSATPYRNDLKAFDVDVDYTSSSGYEATRARGFIREVSIKKRNPVSTPEDFIEDVLHFYDTTLRTQQPRARVIIRCDRKAAIARMGALLIEAGRRVVAIHERFSDAGEPAWQRRSVPSRKRHAAYYEDSGPVFWIHQFKLLEGIDDDRFRLLALWEPLGSARAFIQQVGRVLRNPDKEAAPAYILDHTADGRYRRLWDTFIAYERRYGGKAAKNSREQDWQEYVNDSIERQPPVAYVDREFRSRFTVKTFSPLADLQLPLVANLLRRGDTFSLARVAEAIEKRLEDDDRIPHAYPVDARTRVWIYFSVGNTPFLRETYLMAYDPGVTVLHDLPEENLVAYYDSSAAAANGLPGLEGAVRAQQLRRLFSQRPGSRLVEVAMKSSQLGHRAPRSRSVSAASLEDTVPALDDHVQVLTRAVGYSVEQLATEDANKTEIHVARRYVGFGRAHVSESGELVEMRAYLQWLSDLAKVVAGDRAALTTFGRFAREATPPVDKTPRNVLLDVFEVIESFRTSGDSTMGVAKNEPAELENLCSDAVKLSDGRAMFSVKANGRDCEVEIAWESQGQRYVLRSDDLEKMYSRRRGIGPKDLLQYLNAEQSFRVLPDSPNRIYIEGRFYELVLPVGSHFDAGAYHVGKILVPATALASVDSEKGKRCRSDHSGWQAGSLFDVVSRGGQGVAEIRRLMAKPDILVCDDLGTEVADFIASSVGPAGPRVILIHAKVGSGEGLHPHSASEISEVCAQALKNIRYLSMFNGLRPKNLTRWTKRWSAPKVKGHVTQRIRRGPKNPENAWTEIQARISNPQCEREVWLLLGRMLSKSKLEAGLMADPPVAEAVQAVTLLHATLAAVGSIDAKLRVFCYEE